MEFCIKPIGVIHSPYKTKDECPIQGAVKPDGIGQIDILPEYEDGLKDIDTFSHIILLYMFDQAGDIELVRQTFLDDTPHGVFASRHPCRPNSIGLSIVRLLKRNGGILKVSGIDVLDQTPVIDIKPYVPRFDHHEDATNGWVAAREWRAKPPGRE